MACAICSSSASSSSASHRPSSRSVPVATAAGLAALDASLTLEPDYAPALLLTARINDFSGNLTPAALFYMRTLLSREPAAASEDHLLIWLLNALEGIDDSSDFAAEKGVRQLHCTPPEGGAGLTNGISRLRKTIAEKKENLTVSETWFGDLSVDHTDEELATALFMAAMPGYNGSQAVATADSTIARVRHSHAALLAEMLKDRPIQSTDSRNDAANPETDRTEQSYVLGCRAAVDSAAVPMRFSCRSISRPRTSKTSRENRPASSAGVTNTLSASETTRICSIPVSEWPTPARSPTSHTRPPRR